MKYVRVTCRNRKGSSIMMDPMSDETKLAILRGTPAPVVRDKPLDDMAADKIYRNEDGRIGLPSEMLLKCLVLAGAKVPFKGRTNVSKADGSTMLYSFFSILDPFLVFTNIPKGGGEKKFWKASMVAGKQNQGGKGKGKGKGGATIIVRPEFPQWEFTVTISYDETMVNEAVVKKLFTEGGLNQGLGAWRPNCGGNHGQFEVAEWTDVTDEFAQEEKAV